MTRDELFAGLVALRVQVDGLIRGLDEAEAREAPAATNEGGACVHPDDARVDVSTMGRRRFRCRACRALVDE